MKDSTTAIFTSLSAALESRHFLATLGMEKDEMTAWIRRSRLRSLADELQHCRDGEGRFSSPAVVAAGTNRPAAGCAAAISASWPASFPVPARARRPWP